MNEIQSLPSIKRIEVLQASTLYGSGLVDYIYYRKIVHLLKKKEKKTEEFPFKESLLHFD